MRWTRYTLCAIVAFVSLNMAACGPTHPGYESIEENINNPSGEVDQNTTSSAWSGYKAQGTSTPFMSSQAKVKFLQARTMAPITLSDYLVKAGIPKGLISQVTQYLPHKNDYSPKPNFNNDGGLVAKQSINIPFCFSGKTDGTNASFSVNLACVGQGSGSMSVAFYEWDGNSGSVEVIFKNACDKNGDCVHGAIGLKASVIGPITQRSGKVVYAYDLTATRKGKTVYAKGGFRLSYKESSQKASLEVVGFVKGPKGEGSVVMVFESRGTEASFSIKGKNGTFSCSTSDSGQTGSCQGTNASGNFSWKSEVQ